MKKTTFFPKLFAHFLTWCVLGYRAFRPLLGSTSCCRFTISCSEFALLELQTQPLGKALWSIAKRVGSCHQFNRHRD